MVPRLGGCYRAILFDVGWTLAYPEPDRESVVLAALKQRGFAISPAVWSHAYWAAEAFYRARRWHAETGRDLAAFWSSYYGTLLDRLPMVAGGSELIPLLGQEVERGQKYHLYPDTLDALAELRRRGFALGAVSNWNARLPALCEEWGIAPYLDALIVSDIAGFAKPDQRIFEQVLSSLRVSAGRTLHVGDDYRADVEGARAAGITPVLLDRENLGHQLSCLRAGSLWDLLQWVGEPYRGR